MTIGREEADISIEDPEISRRHAEVRPAGDGIEVEDLGSTNGTFVNGSKIDSPTALSGGDTVRVGQAEIQVEPAPSAGGTVVAPSGGTAISKSPPPSDQGSAPDASDEETQAWQPAPKSDSPTVSEPAAYQPPPASDYTPPPAAGYTPPQAPGYTPPPGDYTPPSQTGGAPYTPPVADQGYSPPQGPPAYQPGPSYGTGPQSSYGAPGSAKGGGRSKAPLVIGALVLLLALAAVALFVWPGLLKPSDEDEVRDVAVAFGEAIGDPDVFCHLMTQQFLEEQSGLTGEEAVQACEDNVAASDEEPAEITVTNINVQGERATADVSVETPEGTETGTMEFENQDGEWLIDSVE